MYRDGGGDGRDFVHKEKRAKKTKEEEGGIGDNSFDAIETAAFEDCAKLCVQNEGKNV